MTDRRRKRSTTSSFASDTVEDFIAVTPTQSRRRSGSNGHESGIRQESWMSKVSLAMSSRIFSGGKKINNSRSTQVMPVGVVVTDSSNTSMGRNSSSSVLSLQETEFQQTPTSRQHTLRLVASEKDLGSSTDLLCTSSPVSTFACPSMPCDVGQDDSNTRFHGDEDRSRSHSHGSEYRRGDSQRWGSGHSSTVVQKVTPGDEDQQDDDEELMTRSMKVTLIPSRTIRSRDTCEDTDTEVNVQDAAPILKGFFSKTVVVSKKQRQQQREQKREALYRESKQRQDKLREQTDRDRVKNEESSRKRKVEQLRRLNQQRRKELLRTAANARKNLLERIHEDNEKYQSERERWENDFEDEMRVLNAAFRKARTSDENRPMTVAGLAVPEAISQLERDASNFEKRVKTAQPALASPLSLQRRTERPSTSGSSIELLTAPFFESCKVLALEDSKDVFDLFEGDDQANDLFPAKQCHVVRQLLDFSLDELLVEREKLLQRLDAIDHIVQTQQQQEP